jgi:TPR repeat protein
MRPWLTICCFLLIWPSLSPAGDIEAAKAAYSAADYRKVLHEVKHMARNEDPEAQYLLGLLYFNGQGVRQNTDQGLYWLEKSADNGFYSAAAELGQIYLSGSRVPRDETKAAFWIERSTELAEASGDAEDGCE